LNFRAMRQVYCFWAGFQEWGFDTVLTVSIPS
jgi:hypothetical protein